MGERMSCVQPYFGYAGNVVARAPTDEIVEHLGHGAAISEGGRADLHRGRAGEEEREHSLFR